MLCAGEIREEKLPYEIHLNRDVYVVKDVPMETCVRCGERYISLETSKMLDDAKRKISDHQLSKKTGRIIKRLFRFGNVAR